MVMTERHFTEELESLAEDNAGVLIAANVVDWASRNPNSALHRQFQWDDEIAGHEYRLQQARLVIARVKVRVIDKPNRRVRAYVSLREDRDTPGGGYRTIANVMSDADQRAALVSQAKTELNRWRKRYSHLEELAAVFAAIDGVEAG